MNEPTHAEIMRAVGRLEGASDQLNQKVDQLHRDIVDARTDAKVDNKGLSVKLDEQSARLRILESRSAADAGARNKQRAIITSIAALGGGGIAVIIKAVIDKFQSGGSP